MNRPSSISDTKFKKRTNLFFIIFYMLLCLSSAMHAPHNNYTAFSDGTISILNGIDPYPAEWINADNFRNWFLYSPSFAIFFFLFSTAGVGLYAGSYGWMMLNLFVFGLSLSNMMQILDGKDKLLKRWWYFLALFLVLNELMGTLTNLQSNAFIIGLSILGLSYYIKGRYLLAGFLLAVGVNFKLLPIVITLLIILDFKKKFIVPFLILLISMFIFPLLFISGEFYFDILHHWFSILLTDPVHSLFLGLEPTLLSYGINISPTIFMIFTLINALAIAIVSFKAFKKSPEQFFQIALPLALTFMVIFNKRAERPSFIIVAPVFIFVLHQALLHFKAGNKNLSKVHALFLATAWFFISMSYSDLCPKGCRVLADSLHFKIFGAITLYIWAWWQSFVLLSKNLIESSDETIRIRK